MSKISAITTDSGADFQSSIENGELVVFPTDTLYGIACDPDDRDAIDRIYELKGRPPVKPSAVMYFSIARLLDDLGDDLEPSALKLIEGILPGPFTLVVANPKQRFAASCADSPEKLGLRVPDLTATLAPLGEVESPVMQTSANLSGGPDPTAVEDIDSAIIDGVDLVIDGGPLLGYGSTVADVSELDQGKWRLLRSVTPRSGGKLNELIGFPPTAS